jgi:N-acetyl-anhydromuramyl-L-alanine amidase AmpD
MVIHKQLLFLIFFLLSVNLTSAQVWEINQNHDYDLYFNEAYAHYPLIPKGILESVAYTNTHIKHIKAENTPSCVGLPAYFGVMGLVNDGQNYFKNTLNDVANMSGYTIRDIKSHPRINILAFAKVYNQLLTDYNLENKPIEQHFKILDKLSEIPNDGVLGNNFAFESHLFSVFNNLNNEAFQNAYKLPKYTIDLKAFFGAANYKILSASKITIGTKGVTNNLGDTYSNTNNVNRIAPPCSDIPVSFPYSVVDVAADPSNYSSRSGTAITHITIHTMQGTYAGSISWFQNSEANVSAHYNIRASDGQIAQSVCEIDKAWHVSNSNPYAVGIEHEGYIDDPSWYTNIMYIVSAELSKDIASRNTISTIRTYDINGDSGLNPLSDGCFKIKGHQHFPSQTHEDPGPFWDWNRYYDLINSPATTPTNTYTNCSGTLYDSGGSTGDYTNDERIFYLIAPTNASEVTVTFSTLDLELNYDYLYIYDGDSYNNDLITVLNGSTLPSNITAYSGKMLLEFRTDCSTVASGWSAIWTCDTTAPVCEKPTNLNVTNLNHNDSLLDWDDVASASSYEIRIKQSIASSWTSYTSTDSEIQISGLAANALYIWQVKSMCSSGNESVWVGDEFVKEATVSDTLITACEGTLTDTGGVLGNYKNYENYTYTIAPQNASSVTLSFTSFDVELNYDYVYIYDGSDMSSPLLGTYTGSTLPPNIVSSCGSLTLEFYSDISTTSSGWEATWVCGSLAVPEIETLGNSTAIMNGDSTPSISDDTDFGAIDLSNSVIKTFTIDNTSGTGDLLVSSIDITGTDSSDFVVGNITLPLTISAGNTTTFTVNFTPLSVGVKTASVSINNSDCDEPIYNYALQGEGEAALGVDNYELKQHIILYPNPNKGVFNILCTEDNPIKQIRVFDVIGKRIKVDVTKENSSTYNVRLFDVSSGTYLIKIETSKQYVIKRAVVE